LDIQVERKGMTQEPTIDSKDLDINIVNVVASVTLNQKFNLLDIVKNFRNVEYNRERFPGLVFRLKQPKTATLIFSTGKMVCTGAKSEKMAKRAVNKVVRELKNGGRWQAQTYTGQSTWRQPLISWTT